MRLVLKNRQFAIFDDFLSTQDFELIQKCIHNENYLVYNADKFAKVYRVYKGEPLFGKSYLVSDKFHNLDSDPAKHDETLTGINIFIDKLLNHSENLVELIGKKDVDWDFFTSRLYRYPKNSGLTWHDDGGDKKGSYTFYTHPLWNMQWGGDLFVPDESTINHDYQLVSIDESYNMYSQNKNVKVGIGQYIVPKPNRLVVIAGGNPHKISKVEPNAGDNMRSSVSGFFMKQ